METENRPNVLFICVDDLNDYALGLGGYSGPVSTPHLERLAGQGVLFTRAYCPSPLCNPSRTALMTGLNPWSTGIYGNGQWWRPHLPDVVTLPEHFRANGYRVTGCGKVFHHTPGFNPPSCWDEYFENPVFEKDFFKFDGYPLNGIADRAAFPTFDWGSPGNGYPENREWATADWACDFLKRKHGRPFFLACGFTRPHLPWYVPKEFCDLYPAESIILPEIPETSGERLPSEAQRIADARGDRKLVLEAEQRLSAVRAY